MNQQNEKSGNKFTKAIPSMDSVKGAITGTTGLTILGAAAVGVAGYLIWKNRETITTFVGKYVDLPEFITGDESSSDESLSSSKSANLGRSSYSSTPTTSHRM